jgi:hypothetical protein
VLPKPKKKLTEEQVRRKMCTGKVKFDSEGHANWALRDMAYLGGGIVRRALGSYECRFCGGWHVGHKNKAFRTPEIDAAVTKLVTLLQGTV